MKKYLISLFTFWYLAHTMPMESEKPMYKASHSVLVVITPPVSGSCQIGDNAASFVYHFTDRHPSKPALRGLKTAFKLESKN